MKIKSGYLLREVAGSFVVVPVGEETLDFSGVITLNESGAQLWKKLEKGMSKEDVVKEMLAEYDAPEDVIKKDVDEFIEKLTGADLLE
ncbi:MAG: PqqD family protein [Firmicutes bacterium]|nr:PqqD family protein [Bacillota bacterium]